MLPAGTNTMELQSGSTTGRAEPQSPAERAQAALR